MLFYWILLLSTLMSKLTYGKQLNSLILHFRCRFRSLDWFCVKESRRLQCGYLPAHQNIDHITVPVYIDRMILEQWTKSNQTESPIMSNNYKTKFLIGLQVNNKLTFDKLLKPGLTPYIFFKGSNLTKIWSYGDLGSIMSSPTVLHLYFHKQYKSLAIFFQTKICLLCSKLRASLT